MTVIKTNVHSIDDARRAFAAVDQMVRWDVQPRRMGSIRADFGQVIWVEGPQPTVVYLPEIDPLNAGESIVVKFFGSAFPTNVRVEAASSQTIDHQYDSVDLVGDDASMALVSDGRSNWTVVSGYAVKG